MFLITLAFTSSFFKISISPKILCVMIHIFPKFIKVLFVIVLIFLWVLTNKVNNIHILPAGQGKVRFLYYVSQNSSSFYQLTNPNVLSITYLLELHPIYDTKICVSFLLPL